MEAFQIQTSHKQFDLSHGFLPQQDPLLRLPESFSEWEIFAAELPDLLINQKLHDDLLNLPAFPIDKLKNSEERERAMVILSFLAHAYVWQDSLQHPAEKLPEIIAKPWYAVAQTCQRPPVLSYASYALYNWHRLDPQQPIALGNIALNQHFLGGMDESWFILVHIDIEAKAIPALENLIPAQKAVEEKDTGLLIEKLKIIAKSLQAVCETLKRMPERCDPYIYYNRVRPYLHGWKNNPALEQGLIYQGVIEYQNLPMKFKGETGAQSGIIPALDIALSIQHKKNPLKEHLDEMPMYMPKDHREFLLALAKGSSIRQYVLDHYHHEAQLRATYNECVQLIGEFRLIHLHYAASYVEKQAQTAVGNPTKIGTGGTPFMRYLRKHKNETKSKLI